MVFTFAYFLTVHRSRIHSRFRHRESWMNHDRFESRSRRSHHDFMNHRRETRWRRTTGPSARRETAGGRKRSGMQIRSPRSIQDRRCLDSRESYTLCRDTPPRAAILQDVLVYNRTPLKFACSMLLLIKVRWAEQYA